MLPKGERARRARGRLPLPCGHTLYAVCKTLVRGEIRGLSPGPRCVRGDTFGLPSSPRRPVAQACMCGGHHGPWPPRCRAPAPRHVTCHLSHVTPSPDVAPSRAHRRRETTRIDPARQKSDRSGKDTKVFRFARHIAEFAPHQFSDVGSTGSRVTDAGWHELLSLHSQLDGEVAQTTTLLCACTWCRLFYKD